MGSQNRKFQELLAPSSSSLISMESGISKSKPFPHSKINLKIQESWIKYRGEFSLQDFFLFGTFKEVRGKRIGAFQEFLFIPKKFLQTTKFFLEKLSDKKQLFSPFSIQFFSLENSFFDYFHRLLILFLKQKGEKLKRKWNFGDRCCPQGVYERK